MVDVRQLVLARHCKGQGGERKRGERLWVCRVQAQGKQEDSQVGWCTFEHGGCALLGPAAALDADGGDAGQGQLGGQVRHEVVVPPTRGVGGGLAQVEQAVAGHHEAAQARALRPAGEGEGRERGKGQSQFVLKVIGRII